MDEEGREVKDNTYCFIDSPLPSATTTHTPTSPPAPATTARPGAPYNPHPNNNLIALYPFS
jgi:hypothetical protein